MKRSKIKKQMTQKRNMAKGAKESRRKTKLKNRESDFIAQYKARTRKAKEKK